MVNLTIQSFGRESEYRRAILTILSFFAWSGKDRSSARVVLFTDRVGYFDQYLGGLPVEYILLSAEKIKEMRGDIDFLHRIKIAVIEESFKKFPGNMLYADSDTFFIADPMPLMAKVSPEKSYMHLWEYRFESMRELPLPMGESFRAFLSLIETSTFSLTDGSEVVISPEQISWNAGVMFFHATHARFIPDVYKLTDQFYPATQNHASEQYAFSVMLQNHTEIQPCDSVIYHYWYRVKKQIIDLFLEEQFRPEWAHLPLGDKLDIVKQWTMELPEYFEKHILMAQDNAIQAFNDNLYKRGYTHALKAWVRSPLDLVFLRNVLYHTKRKLINK